MAAQLNCFRKHRQKLADEPDPRQLRQCRAGSTINQDRHEKTECARSVARAKGASGIARKIKSQIKAGPGLASSCPGRENIAAHKSPHVHSWKRLTGLPASPTRSTPGSRLRPRS